MNIIQYIMTSRAKCRLMERHFFRIWKDINNNFWCFFKLNGGIPMTKHSYTTKNNIGKKNVLEKKKKKKKEEEEEKNKKEEGSDLH